MKFACMFPWNPSGSISRRGTSPAEREHRQGPYNCIISGLCPARAPATTATRASASQMSLTILQDDADFDWRWYAARGHLLSLPRDARLMWLGAGAVGASDASRPSSFQTPAHSFLFFYFFCGPHGMYEIAGSSKGRDRAGLLGTLPVSRQTTNCRMWITLGQSFPLRF
jgi:hypothetical protein